MDVMKVDKIRIRVLLFFVFGLSTCVGCDYPLRVKGRVLDPDGIPIVNAHVELQYADGSWKVDRPTKDDGTFYMDEMGYGEYKIVVTKDGFETQRIVFCNDSPTITTFDITLKPIPFNEALR